VNVLFDLDGTLTDPREGIVACIKYALVALNHPVPPDRTLVRFIGPPLRDAFAELLRTESDSDSVETAVAIYRERYTTVGLFENAVYEDIPRAVALLSERGARLFVATSKPTVYAERIVEHFEIARYFDRVYGSELDGRLSDKGELIAHALSASSLSSADTIMVGDRRHDVLGALKNHVLPVGVLWGYGSRQELVTAGAEKLMKEPNELSELVV
jgi:phosphoglycolate phosphatase